MTVGSGALGIGCTSLDASSRSKTESGSGVDPEGSGFHCFQSDVARLVVTPRPSPFHFDWATCGGVVGVEGEYR